MIHKSYLTYITPHFHSILVPTLSQHIAIVPLYPNITISVHLLITLVIFLSLSATEASLDPPLYMRRVFMPLPYPVHVSQLWWVVLRK